MQGHKVGRIYAKVCDQPHPKYYKINFFITFLLKLFAKGFFEFSNNDDYLMKLFSILRTKLHQKMRGLQKAFLKMFITNWKYFYFYAYHK